MALTYAQFVAGETQTIDYTPESAVTGGDVTVLSNNVWFATEDIAASALGALHIGGVWQLPKTAGTSEATTLGALAYWDASANVATATASSNKKIGVFAEAATDSATTVRVLSIPQAV